MISLGCQKIEKNGIMIQLYKLHNKIVISFVDKPKKNVVDRGELREARREKERQEGMKKWKEEMKKERRKKGWWGRVGANKDILVFVVYW